MGLSLRVRHYWATVNNKDYLQLNTDGSLSASDFEGVRYNYEDQNGESFYLYYESTDPNHTFTGTNRPYNQNFNAFNVYLTYQWQIAPGSFVRVVYQDNLVAGNENVDLTYANNLLYLLRQDQTHSLSVRLIYFIDYLTVRNWF